MNFCAFFLLVDYLILASRLAATESYRRNSVPSVSVLLSIYSRSPVNNRVSDNDGARSSDPSSPGKLHARRALTFPPCAEGRGGRGGGSLEAASLHPLRCVTARLTNPGGRGEFAQSINSLTTEIRRPPPAG